MTRVFVFLISGVLAGPRLPACANELQIRNMLKSTGELSMGALITEVDGCVIDLASFLSAGDFFSTLKVDETSTGIEYRQASRQVSHFPQTLQINVVILPLNCERRETAGTDAIELLLRSLRWTAAWKTGVNSKSPEKIETTFEPGSPDEIEKRIRLESELQIPTWKVTITLRDQDAPLSDSLVLTASTQSGSFSGRCSGHLSLEPVRRNTKLRSKAAAST